MTVRKGKAGKKLTPAQVEEIKRLWPVKGGNATEVAQRVGCSPRSVARYVVQHNLPEAADLYARALDRGEREGLATVRKARRKVSRGLDSARTPKAIAELTRAAVGVAQCAANAKLVHAKLSGALVEKHEVSHSGNLVIHMPGETAPDKGTP